MPKPGQKKSRRARRVTPAAALPKKLGGSAAALASADGSGLFDMFRPRDHYNNISRRTLEQYGDGIVTGITLSRAPIRRILRQAINLITLGKFEDALSKFGHDRLFHLSAIVDLVKDGVQKRVVVEKNAVINVSTSIINEPDAEFFPIHVVPNLTLKGLLDNTQAALGANYFPYDAFHNNCQHFIQALLRANGLLSVAADRWLFQDMSQVQTEIPKVSKAIANGVTHLGAVADRILGRGMADEDLAVLVGAGPGSFADRFFPVFDAVVSDLQKISHH